MSCQPDVGRGILNLAADYQRGRYRSPSRSPGRPVELDVKRYCVWQTETITSSTQTLLICLKKLAVVSEAVTSQLSRTQLLILEGLPDFGE